MGKIAEFYCKVLADEGLRNRLTEILQGRDITAADDEQLQRIGGLARYFREKIKENDLPFDRGKHAVYSKNAKKCVQNLLRRCYDRKTGQPI